MHTAELRVALGKLESEARQNGLARLAAAIQKELERDRISGSAWAITTGCGFRVLQPENEAEKGIGAMLCGTAYMLAGTRTFLYLFSDPEHRG
jgi:hypothetical protein